MENHQKLETLKLRNPFISASISDPWTDTEPDVPSIHQDVFDFILQAIEQKRTRPQSGIAGLILGEAGAGKTHLITRLHKRALKDFKTLLFSYIQPIEDPGQTFRYLLKEIVINLCRPIVANKPVTQLDILLGRVLTELLIKKIRIKQITSVEQRELIKKQKADPTFFYRSALLQKVMNSMALEKFGSDFLLTEYPNLDEQFLKTFFRFRLAHLRAPALSWLKGVVLDEADAQALDVAGRLKANDSFLEQEARTILFSLGLLLARYNYVLLVCFDRMENLETEAHLFAFGKMVELLVDQVPAMLPLAFFRGQLWEERFKPRLNEHVVSRLATNRMILKGCDLEAALNIVQARLAFAYELTPSDDFFPFEKEQLEASFGREVLSPREVIIEANEQLKRILGDARTTKTIAAGEKLHEEFTRQFNQLMNNIDSVSPDRLRLRHTLNLYLKSYPSQATIKLQAIDFTGENKDTISFICTFREETAGSFTIAFIIDDAEHHKSVNATLLKAIEYQEQSPSHTVFYIRDRKSKFPGPDVWKATHKTLARFKDGGGIFIKLNRAQAMAWYALTFLHYKVVERNVSIPLPNNRTRPVTENEFMEFVSGIIHNRQQKNLFDLDERILRLRVDQLKKRRLKKLAGLEMT